MVVQVVTVQEVRWSLVAAVRLLCLLRAPWPDWAGLGWLGWARLGSADAAEGGPGPALAPGPRRITGEDVSSCKLAHTTYKLPILYTEGENVSSAYGQRNIIFVC